MIHYPKDAEIYQLIGQIATDWSEIEGLWYLIFTWILKKHRGGRWTPCLSNSRLAPRKGRLSWL